MRRHHSFALLTVAVVVAGTWLSAADPIVTPPISFGPPAQFAAGAGPSFVAIGDLNDDGALDLAVANQQDNTVSVHLGDGSGVFGSPAFFAVGVRPAAIAVHDLDDDGRLDLAVANADGGDVSVLLGDGAGGFSAARNFTAGGGYPVSIAIADLNRDDIADLVVASTGSSGSVAVLHGDGLGSFGPAYRPSMYVGGSDVVAIDDLDGDGNPDLAVGTATGIFVLLGEGAGVWGTAAFGAAAKYETLSMIDSLVIADFDRDGAPDLAASSSASLAAKRVSILHAIGDGSFEFYPTHFDVDYQPSSLAVGDLNGDTNPDLVTATSVNNISVLVGDGTGAFAAATNVALPGGMWPISVAIGDLNGDGRLDVVTANQLGNSVSVLLNIEPDSDGDGVSDGDEIAAGSDPLNSGSVPEIDDGHDNDLDGEVDEGFPDGTAGPAAPIAHAGADQTVEGGAAVTLDATTSWDADGDPLTFAWTQIEGPPVSLALSDPAHPTFTAAIPGVGGVAAENQVVAFRLIASDGASASAPSDVRITILKPFVAAHDGPAIVTTTACTDASGGYAAGSYGAALSYAVTHPGTRVTFNIPASDPGYHPAGGFWRFPGCPLPLLRYSTNPASPLNANGTTIDGWSQAANAQAAGIFVNSVGPAIFVPDVILEVSHWSDPVPPSRIVIRGLAQDMSISNANHLVLSGNHYNVMPDGLSQSRGAFEQVNFSSGGVTCNRLAIGAGTNVRVGGATPEERNLFGGGCPMFTTTPANHRPPIAGLKVIGNYFGVDRTGTRSILDQSAPGVGVQINGTRELAPVDAQFGGVEPGAGNLVSGFGPETALLVNLGSGGDRIVMLGNRIGTDAGGTVAIANGQGVVLQQARETGAGAEWIIGGPEPGAGNLIAGSTGAGVFIDNQSGSDGAWRMRFQGNAIGTSADGLSAIPNQVGIRAETAGGDTLIGGAGRGEGNVVSGNRENGLYLDGYPDGVTPGRVLGNLIGVGRDGTTALGNGRHGITSWFNAQAVSVGGVSPGEGNVIAFNGGNGYAIETCCGATPRRGTVRGNSIHHNGGIGIALSNFTTPTPNNPGDAPVGPNDRRNYPVLVSATSGAGGTTIEGTLDTIPGLPVTLDFYANTAGPDQNEGEHYLGSHSLVAAAGDTPFTAVLPDVILPAGAYLTATTTDVEGNTSEFSDEVVVAVHAKAPSMTVVTCEDAIYNGLPHTTCTAHVTGAGGLDEALPVSYSDNLAAGTASASASFAGDDAHDGSSASTTFAIAKAPSVTAVTCADVTYNGAAQAPCTARVTGIGGLDQAVPVNYADNIDVGTASANASYGGDANHEGSAAATTFAIAPPPNAAPACGAAAPSISTLWPPNHRMVPIEILGVTDAEGDAIAIRVDGILQDEPTNTVGDGNTSVDGGVLDGGARAWVRAERSGTPRVPGDGRLYEIFFTATDAGGAQCTGVVTVGVPHNMGRPVVVDSGVRYDSTTGARVP